MVPFPSFKPPRHSADALRFIVSSSKLILLSLTVLAPAQNLSGAHVNVERLNHDLCRCNRSSVLVPARPNSAVPQQTGLRGWPRSVGFFSDTNTYSLRFHRRAEGAIVIHDESAT